MALIDATLDSDLQYIGIRANSAEEMFAKLTAAVAALQTGVIIDMELKGCAAAPHFMATLVVASASEGNSVAPDVDTVGFVVVGGVGGIDPIALAAQLQADIIAVGQATLYRVLMAGGGAGPHWMGVAMYED